MIVNNSSNINKTKESLDSDSQQFLQFKKKTKESVESDSQQFLQYQQDKESLDSDSQQFLQFQQNKRKFKQWWSTIPPISTKQKKF